MESTPLGSLGWESNRNLHFSNRRSVAWPTYR